MNLENMTMEELQALRRQKEVEVSRYHNLQHAKKIQLNSAYGALA